MLTHGQHSLGFLRRLAQSWSDCKIVQSSKNLKEFLKKSVYTLLFCHCLCPFVPTYPRFCWLVIGVVVNNDVEDDQQNQVGIEGGEGHQAAELALVHHVHECGKHQNFGYTIKSGFEQKKYLVQCYQRVFLCPVSRKTLYK